MTRSHRDAERPRPHACALHLLWFVAQQLDPLRRPAARRLLKAEVNAGGNWHAQTFHETDGRR